MIRFSEEQGDFLSLGKSVFTMRFVMREILTRRMVKMERGLMLNALFCDLMVRYFIRIKKEKRARNECLKQPSVA
ncbi:hypothetical protein D6C00_14175 [Thiohalobacter thiocyanaticus]|uniref:Uncharacterized protein n=1 Tax=Thiohalobacter thiocyanaticus TaxID=585455 RepID=A0A426QMH0_9GAMM|nr:hypothetical protein D6C00_14175 [Thiohalobacter thiocyanaticus]